MKLVLASKNRHKLTEMQTILGQLGLEVVLESEVGVDVDVDETGVTFMENALLKAKAVCEASGMAAIADDSGLEVMALDGRPGIYSARYAENDKARRAKLLAELEGVADRSARFVCVLAIAFNGEVIETFEGVMEGTIIDAPRGENGFGYDPIFYYPPMGMSTAEMAPEDKNQVSHRGNALKVFYEKLKEAGYADK